MAILTFVDTGVLLAAYRGEPQQREPSLAILSDPLRSFVASEFLYMETMPKAIYHRNKREIAFYRAYFDKVHIFINDVEAIVSVALDQCERCGLAAMDAMHIAAAYLAGAEVLLTLERTEKPIYRTSLVRVECVAATH